MVLTLKCETCHETFEGGLGMSFVWSGWHTERHKREAADRAARAEYIARRARRAFGWRGMR